MALTESDRQEKERGGRGKVEGRGRLSGAGVLGVHSAEKGGRMKTLKKQKQNGCSIPKGMEQPFAFL